MPAEDTTSSPTSRAVRHEDGVGGWAEILVLKLLAMVAKMSGIKP